MTSPSVGIFISGAGWLHRLFVCARVLTEFSTLWLHPYSSRVHAFCDYASAVSVWSPKHTTCYNSTLKRLCHLTHRPQPRHVLFPFSRILHML